MVLEGFCLVFLLLFYGRFGEVVKEGSSNLFEWFLGRILGSRIIF